MSFAFFLTLQLDVARAQAVPDDKNYCVTVPDGSDAAGNSDGVTRGITTVAASDSAVIADICSASGSDNEETPSLGQEADNVGVTMSDDSGLIVQGQLVGTVTLDGVDTVSVVMEGAGSITAATAISTSAATQTVSLSLADTARIIGKVTMASVDNVAITLNDIDNSISTSTSTALDLAAASDVSINNAGTIVSGASLAINAAGVTGFTLSNTQTIHAGTTLAVDLSGAGDTIVISNSGTISVGNDLAVDVSDLQANTQVTINNSAAGQILAGNDTALDLSDTDGLDTPEISLTNHGIISTNTFNAIDARGLTGGISLINSGTIGAGDDFAVNMSATGTWSAVGDITINNSGLMTAGNDQAVDMQGAGGITLINSGTISANGELAINANQAGGLTLTNTGTISAGNTNTIDARRVTGGVSITNTGDIIALTGTTINLAEQDSTTITGVSITNSGTISSGAGTTIDATQVSNFRLHNEGAESVIMAAGDRAVNAYQASNDVRITNAGQISSGGNEALYLRRSSGDVSVTNSGTISTTGAYAIDIGWEDVNADNNRDAGEYVTGFELRNSGSIMSGGIGTVNISGSQSTFIDNSDIASLIHSDETNAIDGTSATGVIELRNAGGISADNGMAIDFSSANTLGTSLLIINTGGISSGGADTLNLEAARDITISNTGANSAITAVTTRAINASNYMAQFSLINSGTISATNNTIDANDGSGNFVLTNSGIIRSTDTNSVGTSFGVRASGITGQVTLHNSGTISAAIDNAFLAENISDSGEQVRINNFGTVSATGDYALKVTQSRDVEIFNSVDGTISAGGSSAVFADEVINQFTLSNAGMLRSTDMTVTAQEANATVMVVNSGSIIASGTRALNFFDVTGAITFANSGTTSRLEANRHTLTLGQTTGDAIIRNLGGIKSLNADENLAALDYAISADAMIGNLLIENGGTGAEISSATAFAIRADGVDGDVTLMNNAADGIIASAQSNVLLTNATGRVRVHNAGIIRSTGSGGVDYVALDVSNAGGGAFILNSGADSAITTGAQRAIKATGVTGGLAITNQGMISAIDSTIDFANAAGGVTIANSGTIAATDATRSSATLLGTGTTGALTISNSGTVLASALLADLSSADGKITIVNSGIMSTSNSTATTGYLLNANAGTGGLELSNSGTMHVVHDGGGTAMMIDARVSAGGVSLANQVGGAMTATNNILVNADGVGAGHLVFENAGIMSTGGQFAITAAAAPGMVQFSNSNSGGTIFAANNVINFGAASGKITFNNAGMIRSSDAEATSGYVVNAQGGNGGMDFVNRGTVHSVAAADPAAVMLDARLNAGNLTIDNGDSATMAATNNTLIDARLANTAGALTLINEGIMNTGGAYVLRASNLPGAASVTNRGTMHAKSVTIDLRGAGGNVVVTNNAGASIAATGDMAVNLSDTLASVTLTNSGSIAANEATLNADNAIGAVSIANKGGLIRSTGRLALSLDGVNNAAISNSGTISAVDGTTILANGRGVTLTNSGIIVGGDVAISMGSGARLSNSGTISAGSSTKTAIYAAGTNSNIILNDGSKIVGKILASAADIVTDADRHTIHININPHTTYAFDFDEKYFDVFDRFADQRPMVKGSAHAVGVAMMRAFDILAARRGRELARQFYRHASLSEKSDFSTSSWGSQSRTEKTPSDDYVVEESAVGIMQHVSFEDWSGAHSEILFVYENAAAEINASKQKRDSTYTGIGIGSIFALSDFFRFNSFVLAGRSSGETERVVLTNAHSFGQRTITGAHNATHLDGGLSMDFSFPINQEWQFETRIDGSVFLQQSDKYTEGDLYRFANHQMLQIASELTLGVSYEGTDGSRFSPLRYLVSFEVSRHMRSVLKGAKHEFSFLDPDIIDNPDVSHIDEIKKVAGLDAALGFEFQFSENAHLTGQVGISTGDDKLTTRVAGLSLLLRF